MADVCNKWGAGALQGTSCQSRCLWQGTSVSENVCGGDSCGGGHSWQGTFVAGDVCGRGHLWQEMFVAGEK